MHLTTIGLAALLTLAASAALATDTSKQDPCADWAPEPVNPEQDGAFVVEVEPGVCFIVPPLPPHPCAIMKGRVEPPRELPSPELLPCDAIPIDI
jgi:hypothetical protein